jgi:hypothetical protein
MHEGATEKWRGEKIGLTAEEAEETGQEVTFRVNLHREELTVVTREGKSMRRLEDVLCSRFQRANIRITLRNLRI